MNHAPAESFIPRVLATSQLNWLDPSSADTRWVPWREGLRIADLLPERFDLYDGLDLAITVNGLPMSVERAEHYEVQRSDSVLVRIVPRGGGGGGKNPLATIAMVAVMAVAVMSQQYYLATYGTTVTTAAGVTTYTAGSLFASSMVAAAVMVGGAAIVNAVLPAAGVNSSSGNTSVDETSNNYGWSALSNPIAEGRPVPVLYGTKRNLAPNKICQYVSTDGDKQYLNMLFAVAEGEIDSITNVKFDDNPASNYSGVSIVTRLGTGDQTVIPAFNDAINETAVGTEIDAADWITRTLTGENTQRLGFGVSCLSGLYYVNDAGNLANTSVSVTLQARLYGATTWTTLATNTISASTRAAVRRYWEFPVASGQYEVRVKFSAAPESGTRYQNTTHWEYIHEVVPDDFRLPHTALLAITALATDQLSGGAPTVTCDATRANVSVPNGAGGYMSKPASNPAWMALDLIAHRRYGGAWPAAYTEVGDFVEAAAWCDTKGITGSLYLDSEMDVETWLGHIGRFGRFRVLRRGVKVGCISDRPVDYPEQGFVATSANILQGTFGIGYLSQADLADAVEVTYFDPDQGRKQIMVVGDHYGTISNRTPNVSQVTLYPCNDAALAKAYGEYLLRCNRYLGRTASLKLSADALGGNVLPGRVIQIAHDVLHDTQSRRIISGTVDALEVNAPVTLYAGETYTVAVRHQDQQHPLTGESLVEQTTLTVASDTTTSTLTLAAPLDYAPAEDAVVTVGIAEQTLRWYRVTSISRDRKLSCELSALEYAEEIYADDGEAPTIPPAVAVGYARGLTASIIDALEDGLVKRVISLAWRGDALTWRVYLRTLGTGSAYWQLLGSTADTSFIARNMAVGYIHRFSVTSTTSPSDGAIIEVDFSEDAPAGTLEEVYVTDGGIDVPVVVTVDGADVAVWSV